MKKSMKLVLSGLLATMLTGMACVAEAAREVTVNNVEALMRYIGDDTTINIQPGIYNLSHWLKQNPQAPNFWSDFPPDSERPQGVLTGSGGVILSKFKNLTLQKTAADGPAIIVIEEPHVATLQFLNCENIVLQGLRMGHEVEKGRCSGAVLEFSKTHNVALKFMDLYGCGAYGYIATNSRNIYMLGGMIRECTYGIVEAQNSKNLHFDRVTFKDTEQYDMFENYNSQIEFRNCKIENLKGRFNGVTVVSGVAGK